MGKIAIGVPLDYSFWALKKKDIVWKRIAKKLFELKYSCTVHAMLCWLALQYSLVNLVRTVIGNLITYSRTSHFSYPSYHLKQSWLMLMTKLLKS